jgi:DNA-binding response OmpR family regulator
MSAHPHFPIAPSRAADHPVVPPKILLIDDDPDCLLGLRLRLNSFAVQILAAYHGMHGIWMATRERPALIITDERMPQGQGTYVLQCLKERLDTSSIPVIVLTGRRDAGLDERLRHLGAVAVFHKPAAFDQLRKAIASHIELKERK